MTSNENVKFFNDKETLFLLRLISFAYERIEAKQEINEDMFVIEGCTRDDYLKLIENISSKTILFSISKSQNKDLITKIRDKSSQEKIKKLLKRC